MNGNNVLCIVAGRSGGHIIPGIIYARNYTRLHPEGSILFFSTDAQLDRSIIALYPYTFSYVPLSLMPVPGRKLWLYPFFFWQFTRAFFISLTNLYKKRPERVVSMGGYISLPVCIAASVLRIPIDLFELNAVPGKAIEWLAPLAHKVFICFEGAAAYFKKGKTQVVDYPLRFAAEDRVPGSHGRMQLGLDQSKKTLLVLGGSQGSRWLNELVLSFFKAHPELSVTVQVIHQAGGYDVEKISGFYKKRAIQALVFDYTHELHYCYAAADLVVARAGAGTLFELLFFEKQSLIVPLEVSTTAHQVDNAQAMVKMRPDLFTMVRQQEIEADPEGMYALLKKSLS